MWILRCRPLAPPAPLAPQARPGPAESGVVMVSYGHSIFKFISKQIDGKHVHLYNIPSPTPAHRTAARTRAFATEGHLQHC